jgi:hypothetical protein
MVFMRNPFFEGCGFKSPDSTREVLFGGCNERCRNIFTMKKKVKSNMGRARRGGAGKPRKFSAQARARIVAAMKGRAKYPEAAILARKAGVSRIHAYLVAAGKRRSAPLEAMLVGIRAKLAAAKTAA